MQSQQESPKTSSRRLIPAARWNDHHVWPPIGGLRHLIFHANSNGFKRVIRRVGGRVLIDEAEFFRWVDEQNNSNENGGLENVR